MITIDFLAYKDEKSTSIAAPLDTSYHVSGFNSPLTMTS